MNLDVLSNSFVISRENLQFSNGFNFVYTLTDGYLYANKKNTISKYTINNYNIYIIGYILDIRDSSLNIKAIAEKIVNSKKDETFFLDTLDYLGGRYILLIDNGYETEIYTDATCLRPIFHWRNTVFASHEILLREVINNNFEVGINRFSKSMNGYLDYSNSNELYKVNPNLAYKLSDKTTKRIFPRDEYKIRSAVEVENMIHPYFTEQVKWLKNCGKKLYLSLTGGFDSKVTLALTKEIQDHLSYFTYIKNSENMTKRAKWIYRTDKKIVDKLVYNLNLNHQFIFVDHIEVEDKKMRELANHTTSNHAFKLGVLLGETLEKDSIHIRSTLYELGKTPYYSQYENLRDIDNMFEVSTQWMPNTLDMSDAKEMFKSYLTRNDLQPVEDLNYHLPFIIYWETRMANWHSNLTQETDLNHETFIIINNRFMLDLFISLNLKDRKEATLFQNLIRNEWPILNYFIPNTDSDLENELEMKKNEKQSQNSFILNTKEIKFIQIKNIDFIFHENVYKIKPLYNTELKDEEHYIELKNTSNENKIMNIQSFYTRAINRIKVIIDNKEYDITDLVNGEYFIIQPKQNVQIKYKYWNNTDLVSWYNAGKINLTFKSE